MTSKNIKRWLSNNGKKAGKINKMKGKNYFRMMQKLSVKARNRNKKLSTGAHLQ